MNLKHNPVHGNSMLIVRIVFSCEAGKRAANGRETRTLRKVTAVDENLLKSASLLVGACDWPSHQQVWPYHKLLLSSAARNHFHSMHPVASQPGILAATAAFNGGHASSYNLFVPPSLWIPVSSSLWVSSLSTIQAISLMRRTHTSENTTLVLERSTVSQGKVREFRSWYGPNFEELGSRVGRYKRLFPTLIFWSKTVAFSALILWF